ncbi:MAG: LytTR family DNA-binding domain-containing protein, partial [Dokdonella sp.]
MSAITPTALIADDEPLLRRSLRRMLGKAWPELEIVAEARNGREAVEQFEALRPDVCFLDVQMPGLSGVEAARFISRRAHLVFVTAFDRYAVEAFTHGVLDYLVKPVEPERLAETVARLRERLRVAQGTIDTEALVEQLAERIRKGSATTTLRWIRASVGSVVRMIGVDEIDYLRSDEKYTRIAWRGDAGKPTEALIRTPLKELLGQLDATQFVQVHRAVVVNQRAISHVVRGDNETATIHLRGRDEVLPVSR